MGCWGLVVGLVASSAVDHYAHDEVEAAWNYIDRQRALTSGYYDYLDRYEQAHDVTFDAPQPKEGGNKKNYKSRDFSKFDR